MHSLSTHDMTQVLLAVAVLLAGARIFGELAIRLRQPAIIGEIIVGILLGPTLLGRLMPATATYLFPDEGNAAIVLDGLTSVALVLFLLVAGMEVDLSTIFRQGRAAMIVSVGGIAVPFIIGLAAAYAFPLLLGRDAGVNANVFSLFFATIMAISALPVIAKTLMDLNLYRSDLGMIIIAAAIFDDLIGWFIFAIVLGMMDTGAGRGIWIGGTIGLTLAFIAFMLTAGRWLVHRILPWLQARTTWPAGVLGFLIVLALLGGAFTESIGIHAVFGSFVVGVAIGDSPHLRERTRATIDQFVSFIFAPLFFASIGLNLDFIANFDWLLTLIVIVLAVVSKVFSCGLSARSAGLPWRESWAIGFGMNARGAMGIILGLLALDAGVINQRMFVAVMIMAVFTSILSGTAMQKILRRPAPRRFLDFLHQRGFLNPLQATDRDSAIRELAGAAAAITGLKPQAIESAVLQRERMMPTGLGLTVAVPHARVHGMNKPIVCVGISRDGIEFQAPDGERSRMIFMILTPADDDGAQLQILADISRTFLDAPTRDNALRVNNFTEFVAVLKTREPRSHSILAAK